MFNKLNNVWIICSQHSTERNFGGIFELVCAGWNDLRFHIEDVHAGIVKERADRGIATIGVIASGVAELQPITEAFFNTYVHVISGDRSTINSMKAQGWSVEFVTCRWHNICRRLEEAARLAVHGEGLVK